MSKDKPTGATETVDAALQATSDLINEQFRPWYARQVYRLGSDRYLALAKDARREGRDKPKFFSHLLRSA